MGGKKVKDLPPSLTVYEICKTFGCLPSQLDKENNKTIEEFIIIMDAINEHEAKDSKKAKRKELASKHGGVKR